MLHKSVGDAFEKSQHISILRNVYPAATDK